MDPFEARLQFSTKLSKLSASVTDAQKTAAYALKFREYDEDFHSVILEQLGRGDINNQINIMYFLEQLCDATREEPRFNRYIVLIQRDISEIVDLVAPLSPLGKCNIADTKTVLQILRDKQILPADQVAAFEEMLDDRLDTELTDSDFTSSKYQLTRRTCEQRMEDDRERQKRVKDLQWMVSPSGTDEFDALWANAGPITDEDIAVVRAQAEERDVWLKTMKELNSEKVQRLVA